MKCEPLIVNILRKGFLEIFCHCMTKEDEMFGFHGRSAKKCSNARFRNFQHIHLSICRHYCIHFNLQPSLNEYEIGPPSKFFT